MGNAIRNLIVKVSADVSDIQKSMQKAEQSITGFVGGVQKAIAASAVIAGITKLGKAIYDAVTSTAEYADEIGMVADRTGFALGTIQELRYATNQLDTDFSVVQSSVMMFSNKLKEAQGGTNDTAKAMSLLGISLKDSHGQLRPLQDLWFDAINKLSMVRDETKKTMLANMLFGKQYVDLMPIINAGSDEITRLRQEANNLGLVMSDDAINSARAFGDSLDKLKSEIAAVGRDIGAGLTPTMQSLIDLLDSSMPKIKQFWGTFAEGWQGLSDFISGKDRSSEAWTAFISMMNPWVDGGVDMISGFNSKNTSPAIQLPDRTQHTIPGTKDIAQLYKDRYKSSIPVNPGSKNIAELYADRAKTAIKSTNTAADDLNKNIDSMWDKLFGEKAKADVDKTNDSLKEFTDSLREQTKAYSDFVGIFDKATTEQSIGMDRMLNRQRGQLNALKLYQQSLITLQGKVKVGLISQGLYNELSDQGPAAAKNLQSFANATNAQLKEYNSLFGQKSSIASSLAYDKVKRDMSAEASVVQIINNFNGGAKDQDIKAISDKVSEQIIKKLKQKKLL